MRNFSILIAFLFVRASVSAQSYTPAQENLDARHQFQDNKYGMFIHWGLFSLPSDGEWVMNNRNINVTDYKRLLRAFNPVDFDAAKWVATAKNAGMKYIVFITRHHDGFSNWDTKQTDWKITNTPYGKDVLRMLADECHKQGMKLGLYYSLLDWSRDDYPRETGRTGQHSGRTGKSDYAAYLQFMKSQLTELLTNYGEIMSIWFDGHWDQTNPEGSADRTSRIDWKYDEIYQLIHKLQPQCLIGNNHHLAIIPGEDFQMFERDLPGENKSGLSFQKASEAVPLEACETINGSWGYNITDRKYKTVNQVIQLLAGAAGRNSNLLLNIGPMPSGAIQPEFTDTLAAAGKWLASVAESIYGTRGGPLAPQPWGVTTQRDKRIYLHLFKSPEINVIILPRTVRIKRAVLMGTNNAVKYKQEKDGWSVFTGGITLTGADTVIELELQ